MSSLRQKDRGLADQDTVSVDPWSLGLTRHDQSAKDGFPSSLHERCSKLSAVRSTVSACERLGHPAAHGAHLDNPFHARGERALRPLGDVVDMGTRPRCR
jgi:hypothetical protein